LDGVVAWLFAGGYDTRVAENVEHHKELVDFVEANGLQDNVTFLRSFSDGEKNELLKRCRCLIYTPSNEHFGIVPLEAMYKERAVIAVNSGGPLETVYGNPDGPTSKQPAGQTGFLCDPTATDFAKAMEIVATDQKLCTGLGKAGRKRVVKLFSFDAFASQLAQVVADVL
jgi:alpha-1,3/alpha-1,6-mannosyltransferase